MRTIPVPPAGEAPMETLEVVAVQPRDFVAAHLYPNEEAVIQDALRHLLVDRPDLRIAWAVQLYASDEGYSLGGAAQLAGITFWEMRDILYERGVPLRLGPATLEEAQAEAAEAMRWLDAGLD